MEKASGELNLTVITIVAIAAIAAFFYAFVWPAIQRNITRSQDCAAAICPPCNAATCNVQCQHPELGTITCSIRGDN